MPSRNPADYQGWTLAELDAQIEMLQRARQQRAFLDHLAAQPVPIIIAMPPSGRMEQPTLLERALQSIREMNADV